MLRGWMEDNNYTQWSTGCYFVQFQKNSSLYRVINRTPYKALFGADPKLGLSSSAIPKDVLSRITSEEELETFLNANAAIENEQNNIAMELDDNINNDVELDPE
ncbi:hypothetical protein QE152_g1812 [Popillia japonica]|uniref:Uncharacterized protein n=1 Tax=Popillia japonica TaxID=7064 RepID=A0AAW1N4B8_POPJA